MLLGLVRPDAGTMRLFDHEVPRLLNEVIGRVGAVVESPKFDPLRSGASNLWLLASSVGLPKTRVGEVLEMVELADRAKDRFRTYSLGMKQRLAVAATLLKNPDLLIFDEPTNGLDPAGIRDTRALIRRLADQGHAVLISSHLLTEIEQVADTVTIIARGRALYDGPLADLTQDGTSLEDAFLQMTEGVSVGEMGNGNVVAEKRTPVEGFPPHHTRVQPPNPSQETPLDPERRTSVEGFPELVPENVSKPSFPRSDSSTSPKAPRVPPRQAVVEAPLTFHHSSPQGAVAGAQFSADPTPTPDVAPARPRRAALEDLEDDEPIPQGVER
jgi:ABC-type multidrug transport system ATPase subunit